MDTRRPLRAALAMLCLLPFLGGCANDVTDFLIEQPLGALSELAINMQFRMDDDPLLLGYTQMLGQEHLANAKRTNVPYRFKVVDMEAPNAFAIPWGGIYVTRGLLRFADTEDEVGFVIGHEIGHVERRHSSLAFQRNMLISVGLALLTNDKNKDWMQFGYIGNYFLDLHFSRQNETAADRMGALFAVDGGYDPYGGIRFFEKLDQRYGATPRFWGYFQTHPINRDRISYLEDQPLLSTKDPVPITMIADGYYRRSRYNAAAARYRAALDADPQYAAAYLGLARTQAWRGDVVAARESYHQALRCGAEPSVVTPELSHLPERRPVEDGAPILASTNEVRQLQASLTELDPQVTRVASLAEPGYQQPLDASTALLGGYNTAGTLLDQLYQNRGNLAKAVQQSVIGGQKVRGVALRAAADVGGAQSESFETAQLIAQNRERMLAKLASQPTRAAAETARAVLLDSGRALQETREAVERLNELAPAVSDAVRRSNEAIKHLRDAVRPELTYLPTKVEDRLAEAESQTEAALEQTNKARSAAYTGRSRALQSSIDITMLDRTRAEREAAARIIERFCLAPQGLTSNALQDGLSFGEATYVLGMASSAKKPADDLLRLVSDTSGRHSIDQLGARTNGRTQNVSIILHLVDETLKREFAPAAAK